MACIEIIFIGQIYRSAVVTCMGAFMFLLPFSAVFKTKKRKELLKCIYGFTLTSRI